MTDLDLATEDWFSVFGLRYDDVLMIKHCLKKESRGTTLIALLAKILLDINQQVWPNISACKRHVKNAYFSNLGIAEPTKNNIRAFYFNKNYLYNKIDDCRRRRLIFQADTENSDG